VGARLYTVTAEMVPDKPFAITAWSGSFALRVLYDVLRRRGFNRAPSTLDPVK
jgi:hypothetical protein